MMTLKKTNHIVKVASQGICKIKFASLVADNIDFLYEANQVFTTYLHTSTTRLITYVM